MYQIHVEQLIQVFSNNIFKNKCILIYLESLTTGLPEQVHQVFVRASDLNIVCEVTPVPINQPCNMLIKVIKSFIQEKQNFKEYFRLLHIMHQQ